MQTCDLYISDSLPGKKIIRYVMLLIAQNKGLKLNFVTSVSAQGINISEAQDSDFPVSEIFYRKIFAKQFEHSLHLDNDFYIRTERGEIDPIASVFYHVNCLQEYHVNGKGFLGRFSYDQSLQHRFGIVRRNIVQEIIDQLFLSHPKFSKLQTTNRPSRVFLSHDIDTVNGAIREDGYYALKKGDLKSFLKIAGQHFSGKPSWFNMDKIMCIEEEEEFRSVFYWLPEESRMNADYNIHSEKIRDQIKQVSRAGWENGLHKSLAEQSIAREREFLPEMPVGNRFHFLNYTLPGGFAKIEESGIQLDSSVGFTEESGFRNNYGLPFQPFNLDEQRVYRFVEVPMQVMDRTFFRKQIPVEDTYRELAEWFKGQLFNTVISLNFHNNFFSDFKYKGYEELYRNLLRWFNANGIKGISQDEIITEYGDATFFN